MRKMNRLSRRLFQYVIGDRKRRRAVAFAILMKNRKPASVVKDWSYKGLARISGLAPGTCSTYVHILLEMGLVSLSTYKGHTYLIINKLKAPKIKNKRNIGYHSPKHKDIDLGNYDASSVKTIELHLKAISIVETQRRKDYIQQNISATQNPKSLSEYKKAKKICSVRGWNSFIDNGISYKYISNTLHCSPNTVSEVIRYGETEGLFTVTRFDPEIVYYGVDQAREAAEYLDVEWSWCSDDVVVLQRANKFTLNKEQRKKKNPAVSGSPRARRCRKR